MESQSTKEEIVAITGRLSGLSNPWLFNGVNIWKYLHWSGGAILILPGTDGDLGEIPFPSDFGYWTTNRCLAQPERKGDIETRSTSKAKWVSFGARRWSSRRRMIWNTCSPWTTSWRTGTSPFLPASRVPWKSGRFGAGALRSWEHLILTMIAALLDCQVIWSPRRQLTFCWEIWMNLGELRG